MSQQNKQYDGPPATFVNVKRVKTGEVDSKGRERVKLTFGTYTDKNGTERNSLNELIDALLQLQGKQANLDVRVEMKESSSGSTFPSAFVMVTEMIPQTQGQPRFVPKTPSRSTDVKARAAEINKAFKG